MTTPDTVYIHQPPGKWVRSRTITLKMKDGNTYDVFLRPGGQIDFIQYESIGCSPLEVGKERAIQEA